MDYVSGEILTNEGIDKGYLGFKEGRIIEIGKGRSPKKSICNGLVIPFFVNAHTHIGDSFVRKKNIQLPRNVKELVAPPNGLKHRLLREASNREIITGMRESIQLMEQEGISNFCDFREQGIVGVRQISEAIRNKKISALVLSRPKKLEYDRDEVELLLKNSQGIGISSMLDWEYSELEKVARHAKKKGKMFAAHVSERVRENIDLILDLKPDFLVHLIYATDGDLERVRDNNIPVVACPRANMFFGIQPNLKLLKKHHIEMLIGTDNVMVNPPSILNEIKSLKRLSTEISTLELLHMTTYRARKALNLDCNILGPDSPANFIVLDKKSLATLYKSL